MKTVIGISIVLLSISIGDAHAQNLVLFSGYAASGSEYKGNSKIKVCVTGTREVIFTLEEDHYDAQKEKIEITACSEIDQTKEKDLSSSIRSFPSGLEFKCYAHSPSVKNFFDEYINKNCEHPIWKGCGPVDIDYSPRVTVTAGGESAVVSNARVSRSFQPGITGILKERIQNIFFDYSFSDRSRSTE